MFFPQSSFLRRSDAAKSAAWRARARLTCCLNRFTEKKSNTPTDWKKGGKRHGSGRNDAKRRFLSRTERARHLALFSRLPRHVCGLLLLHKIFPLARLQRPAARPTRARQKRREIHLLWRQGAFRLSGLDKICGRNSCARAARSAGRHFHGLHDGFACDGA